MFDSIENQFTGVATAFILKSGRQDVTGIATNNGVILINEIFQNPALLDDYIITETAGITSIRFTGAGTSVTYDVNSSSIPRGVIVSEARNILLWLSTSGSCWWYCNCFCCRNS